MHCPFCRHSDSRVVDSRTADDGAAIRRRRQCPECDRRFTTVETTASPWSSGPAPPSRSAATRSWPASARPARDARSARTSSRCSRRRSRSTIRASGCAEIEAHEVGVAVLAPLRELDEVAYLRFASVYQAFESLEDFEAAITLLRAEGDPTGVEPGRHRPGAAAPESPPAAWEGKPTPPPVPNFTPSRTCQHHQ